MGWEEVIRKLWVVLVTGLLFLVGVVPAQAELVNVQFSEYDTESYYIYSGADIDYFSIHEDTNYPGKLHVTINYNGWVGRSHWLGDDAAFVNFDLNLDGETDYFLATADEFYPSSTWIDTLMIDYARTSNVPGCEAETAVSGGYSDFEDNWVMFRFNKDCLPFGNQVGIEILSSYLGYVDGTDPEIFSIYGSSSSNSGSPGAGSVAGEKPTMRSEANYRTPNPSRAPEDLSKLSPQVLESVVQIFCQNGSGSGWAADVQLTSSQSAAGYKTAIVTNHHVVESCLYSGQVEVKDNTGATYQGVVFAADAANDMAGVVISKQLPTLDWTGETPGQGWWVGVLGSPLGIAGYLSTGIIGKVDADDTLNVSAPIRPGNSGGPVFDREGRVIGVATAYISDTPNINIAGGVSQLCEAIFDCSSSDDVWSTNLAPNPNASSGPQESDLDSGTTLGSDIVVQRAGSQVFFTSASSQGSYEVYEDGVLIDSFEFDGITQAHIVEQRVTGGIQLRKVEQGTSNSVAYEFTKDLLWFQNVNLGSVNENSLTQSAETKITNLASHKFNDPEQGWTTRDSEVTKFICTGIYGEGASMSEKISARKKAKLACADAENVNETLGGEISFFFQTKETKAASYVGKVLVTVKGIEPFVDARLGN